MKLMIVVVVIALLTSACGDLFAVTSPSTIVPTMPCQTAGSTVSILDNQPGC